MAVAVSMASCVKNEDFAGNVPYEGFTVYAGMESTRVSVGESGSGAEGSGRKLSWEDGDAITVFDNGNYAELGIVDTQSGAFNGPGENLADGTDYYVLHAPESYTFLSGTGMTVSAPTAYTINPDNEDHLRNNIVLTGTAPLRFTDGVASHVTLTMRTAYLEIPMQLPEGTADMDVTSLSLESSRSGYFVKCMKMDGLGNESCECVSADAMTVTFSPALKLTATSPKTVKLVVWMMPEFKAAEGDFFTFTLSDASNRTISFTKPLVELHSGRYYTVDGFSIEGESVTDFTLADVERSNCYMVHPTDGMQTLYIPVDKVNKYWSSSISGYGNTPANTISAEGVTAWVAEVIWADFDWKGAGCSIATSAGAVGGVDDYIVMNLMPEIKRGNMVIGVRPQSATADCPEGCYLWSWHLWITDYNPDAEVPENGRVDRWEGMAPMMDRNVGFFHNGDEDLARDMSSGILYYQYGRKDPFPGNVKLWGPDGSLMYAPAGDNSADFVSQNAEVLSAATDTKNSVLNPTRFYSINGAWSAQGGTVTKIWSDYASAEPEAELGSATDEKTMYDPCPAGWKLPHGEYLRVLGTTSTGVEGETADHKRNQDKALNITAKSFFAEYNTLRDGVWYNPDGEYSLVEANATTSVATCPFDKFPVWIPGVGMRNYKDAAKPAGVNQTSFGVLQYASLLNTSSYVYLWSSTPASGANASYLQVARGAGAGINTWNKGAKAAGYPVRCVKVE